MGNRRYQMNQMISNERFLKKSSNDNQMNHMKGTNHLKVKERDYMINTAMKRLGISDEWRPAVARGANYIPGERFWSLVDYATKARKSPARCFIKCINNEMFNR